MTFSGPREAELMEAANLLLNARRTLCPMEQLPAKLVPTSMDEVYFVQDRMAQVLGAIGGWKVGCATAEGEPVFAPMPAAGIGPDNSTLGGGRLRGLEAEVAFLLGKDLPARATPYSREEVAAAVRSCHPAIEVLESGLVNPTDPALRMTQLADLQMHGSFVFGPAMPEWQHIDFTKEAVTMAVDGVVRVERVGSNTAGDLLRLLPWLASGAAAQRTGGLKAGQWVTTGSWTGAEFGMSGSTADAHFSSLGRVALRFA